MQARSAARPGSPHGGLGAILQKIIRLADCASYWLIAGLMLALAVLIIVQVFYRYVLSSSIDSAAELSRLIFVWSMFLAIPHGIRSGIHVGIDIFIIKLPQHLKEFIFRINATFGAALMMVVFYLALTGAVEKWGQLMPTLPISSGLFYIAIAVSAGHSFAHLALLVVRGPNAWHEDVL